MGDPKKFKKKHFTPVHPWIRAEIEDGKTLRKEYGLANRREILIAGSFLKKYKDIAKKLIADRSIQGEKERKQMMEKLQKMSLLVSGASLDDVLSLQLKDVLERRVQSLLFRKGMARSMKQARQFIVHRHVLVGDKELTSPSCLLTSEAENLLRFKSTSALANNDHPERVPIVREVKEQTAEEKAKEEERKEKSRRFSRGERKPGDRRSFNRKKNFGPRKERASAPKKEAKESKKGEAKKGEA